MIILLNVILGLNALLIVADWFVSRHLNAQYFRMRGEMRELLAQNRELLDEIERRQDADDDAEEQAVDPSTLIPVKFEPGVGLVDDAGEDRK